MIALLLNSNGVVEHSNQYSREWFGDLDGEGSFWAILESKVMGSIPPREVFMEGKALRVQLMKGDSDAETISFTAQPCGDKTLLLGEHEIEDYLSLRNVMLDLQNELAETNREIQRRRQQAEELNEQLGRKNQILEGTLGIRKAFLGNLRKDLLMPFKTSSQRLQQLSGLKNLDPDLKLDLVRLANASQSTQKRLDDLVLLSELEAGVLSCKVFPMKLKESLDTIFSLVQRQADGKGVLLSFDVSESCPVSLVTDGGMFKDILLRLIRNAIRFSPNGQVLVLIEPHGGEGLKVQVCDNGIGLSESIRENPFYHYLTNEGSMGKGVGLAIIYQMVKLLGGELSLESKEDQGTTFTLTLPARAGH